MRNDRTIIGRIADALMHAMLALSLIAGGSVAVQAADDAPAPATLVYRLAPDDRLRISVYGEEALTGEFLVNSEGFVSFPLVGLVKATGLTVSGFQQALTTALAASYLNDPKVTAEILQYRPFYILGEVNKPGQYPYNVGMTVAGAVATAGGYTYRANRKQVFVKHASEMDEQRYKLTPSAIVQPGDTIRIGERYF